MKSDNSLQGRSHNPHVAIVLPGTTFLTCQLITIRFRPIKEVTVTSLIKALSAVPGAGYTMKLTVTFLAFIKGYGSDRIDAEGSPSRKSIMEPTLLSIVYEHTQGKNITACLRNRFTTLAGRSRSLPGWSLTWQQLPKR